MTGGCRVGLCVAQTCQPAAASLRAVWLPRKPEPPTIRTLSITWFHPSTCRTLSENSASCRFAHLVCLCNVRLNHLAGRADHQDSTLIQPKHLGAELLQEFERMADQGDDLGLAQQI